MRSLLIIGIILLLGVLAVFLLGNKDTLKERKTIQIGKSKLSAEVADTMIKQVRGLSGRASLSEDEGMLFVYQSPQMLSFWMKDMRFSIDIIWIDENKTIVSILSDISPDTFPQTFAPPTPAQYVLEVQAGWALTHGIVAGDRLLW